MVAVADRAVLGFCHTAAAAVGGAVVVVLEVEVEVGVAVVAHHAADMIVVGIAGISDLAVVAGSVRARSYWSCTGRGT